jgi:anti-sigma factor RsiW
MTDADLTCQQFVELVTDYLDDAMAPDARSRFDRHLAECRGCGDYLDQIRATRRALGRIDLDHLSAASRDQLLTTFRSWRSARPEGSDGD